MTRDLSRVKVLMTHSKSLTPAQQNWPPLGVRAARSEARDASDVWFHTDRLLDGPREFDPGANERYRA